MMTALPAKPGWLLRLVLWVAGLGPTLWLLLVRFFESPPPPPPPWYLPGRPLRVAGTVRSPAAAVTPGGDLAHRVRAGWLADAAAEYASVAAFGRLALRLVALGAPRALVAAVHRAGLEEIEHARLCDEMGSPSGAQTSELQPFPAAVARLRPVRFAELATESLLDGALNETFAAHVAEATGRCCKDARTREVLDAIAKDEYAHAGLAWQIIDWAVQRDSKGVRAALRAGLSTIDRAVPPTGAPGGLVRFGRPDDALLATCFEAARAEVRARLLELVPGHGTHAC